MKEMAKGLSWIVGVWVLKVLYFGWLNITVGFPAWNILRRVDWWMSNR